MVSSVLCVLVSCDTEETLFGLWMVLDFWYL